MATSDSRATRTAHLGVGLVAVTAAVISFSHVRAVAVRSGESDLTSWLLPMSIDGAVVAAVSVLLADSRAGRRPALLTWLLLSLGLAASLAANIASAEPNTTARAVAAWPPLALAIGIEVLAGLARRSDSGTTESCAAPEPLRSLAGARRPNGNGGCLEQIRPAAGWTGRMLDRQPGSVNGRTTPGRRTVDDSSAVALIRNLDTAAPQGRASRFEIQKALGCGGSRAARLAELARGPVAELDVS